MSFSNEKQCPSDQGHSGMTEVEVYGDEGALVSGDDDFDFIHLKYYH